MRRVCFLKYTLLVFVSQRQYALDPRFLHAQTGADMVFVTFSRISCGLSAFKMPISRALDDTLDDWQITHIKFVNILPSHP